MKESAGSLGEDGVPRAYADLALMEDIVRESGLDWTIIRPPNLTNGPLTGAYRTAYAQSLRGGLLVSRVNVAHLILRVLAARNGPGSHQHREERLAERP